MLRDIVGLSGANEPQLGPRRLTWKDFDIDHELLKDIYDKKE